eukprot:CAMPEP_0180539270 /NCGR_PEP_ID=MMETSP1036_2-20121128/66804_1 /TAXON_ID=632150 /ORGANISM="Azadinium spinosum, Strain 3D9" /LENGTH=30 /DNA_ID= /DNA_START= /DNA_END= /DNA_ORIENTATION=
MRTQTLAMSPAWATAMSFGGAATSADNGGG